MKFFQSKIKHNIHIWGLENRSLPISIPYPPNYSQVLNDLFDALQQPPRERFIELQCSGNVLSNWLIQDLDSVLLLPRNLEY